MKKILLLCLFSYSANAFAYLDPGTGSAIIQALLASIAVAAVSIKAYWAHLKNYISKLLDFFSNKKK